MRIKPGFLIALFFILLFLIFGSAVLDYRDHRREILHLMENEALSLAKTAALAAENGLVGYEEWQAELIRRLHEVARAVDEKEESVGLSRSQLAAIAQAAVVHCICLVEPDGSVGLSSVPQALDEEESAALIEFVSTQEPSRVLGFHEDLHWGDGRIAVLLRRQGGGAVLIGMAGKSMIAFRRRIGADRVIREIGEIEGLAFAVLEDAGGVLALSRQAWDTPFPHEDAFIDSLLLAEAGVAASRIVTVHYPEAAREILEAVATLSLPDGAPALVRVGFGTEGLAAARRRFRQALALRGLVSLILGLGLIAFLMVNASRRALHREYDRIRAEVRRMESERHRQEKLTAMGELAAGVAHEIRNPLNTMRMVAQRLAREFQPRAEETEYRELTRAVVSESDRIAGIVEEFLRFARPPRIRKESGDFVAMVDELLQSFRIQAEERGVELRRAVEALPLFLFDRQLMGQALLNLLTNALDTLAEGGVIEVRVRREGDAALLEVIDDGPGMDAQTLARIWDLYYSTKAKGTGMGLPLVHRIAQEHGGGVTVQSSPGAGARFCIRLPMTRATSPEEEP